MLFTKNCPKLKKPKIGNNYNFRTKFSRSPIKGKDEASNSKQDVNVVEDKTKKISLKRM
jgi:hypothetical protein